MTLPTVDLAGLGFDAGAHILVRLALDEVFGSQATSLQIALGAIDALEAAGKSLPPVVGVNAVPVAIAAIKAGKLLATASFDAMKMV